MSKLIALDFDGVIHQYVRPWTNAEEIRDPPMPGAFEFIYKLLNAGYEVAIFSSRSRTLHGQDAMSKWFIKNGFNVVALADLQWPNYKPPAFLTIDDRALRFEGLWPSLEDIRSFKPWRMTTPESESSTSPSG